MDNKSYLFVYGTLRNRYQLKLKDKISEQMEYIGQARVGASLYDLGEYPGAIKENASNEVIGDLFLLTNPDKVFKILDKYEGDEFDRKKDRVLLRSGKFLTAWIYWYNQKPEQNKRIRHKDYLNYLKRKKTA